MREHAQGRYGRGRVAGAVLAALVLAGGVAEAHRGRRFNPTLPTAAYDADVAIAWFELAIDLTRETTGFTPPVAARAFGYMGVTLYEAVVGGMPRHRSLVSQLPELDRLPRPRGVAYHWPTVANTALAVIARGLYGGRTVEAAANIEAINALEDRLAAGFRRVPRGIVRRSRRLGRAIGRALYAWSTTDGGYQAYLRNFPESYDPPVGPGLWVPTPPDFLPALLPDWGDVRPFALDSMDACDPGPPIPYSEEPGSEFFAQALEVYNVVRNLTPEQLEIAIFWADDPGDTATPAGHSISILNIVAEEEDINLAFAAKAYAHVGMAVHDAFVSAWDTKYRYNLLRPITYIQDVIDPSFTAEALPLVTPPFPEYTSGHSVQSAAAAEVMTALFGDLSFLDTTHVDRGLEPRFFESFFDAAFEAAISRLYGGIHFREGIETGIDHGICVGEAVLELDFRAERDHRARRRFRGHHRAAAHCPDDDSDRRRGARSRHPHRARRHGHHGAVSGRGRGGP